MYVKRYYQLVKTVDVADLYIYGDITSFPWFENDVSASPLVQEIDTLQVQTINVYINSYGGEVAEALAIISALNRNHAKVVTYCDGFACSAAADIFMAGDERIMSSASALMIHCAQTYAAGSPDDLRAEADVLDKITDATLQVFLPKVSISEDELRSLFKQDTWLLPDEAIAKGFATSIVETETLTVASQNARNLMIQRIKQVTTAAPVVNVSVDAEAIQSAVDDAIVRLFEHAESRLIDGNGDPVGLAFADTGEPKRTTPMQFISALLG